MKFTEIVPGLIAGKSYVREYNSKRKVIKKSDFCNLFKVIVYNDEDKALSDRLEGLGLKDIMSEWETYYEYPLTFSEAIAEMKKGNHVNPNNYPTSILKYEDGFTFILDESFRHNYWMVVDIRIADYMNTKWRIVNV